MTKAFDIFVKVLWIALGVVVGIALVGIVLYLTGYIQIHHLVAIPGVFEKYQICFGGHEVYHWFVGNVTSVS